MKKYITIIALVLITAVSCDDFLRKENPNTVESEFYFKDENSLLIYTNSMLRSWEPEIIDFVNGDRYSDLFGWDGLYNFYTDNYDVDDMTSWSWTFLRTTNYFLEHLREAKADAEILDHYEGVGRLFRALFYIGKVQQIGACPYYDHTIDPTDKEALYKGRDPRSYVTGKILEDLNYASEHCLATPQFMNRANYVNKYVALAIKARFCLFEGTYRKYHPVDHSTGKAWTAEEKTQGENFLKECASACEAIMASGVYSIIDNPSKRDSQWRGLFIDEDGCGNLTKEFIWARDYDLDTQVNNTKYSINDYMINAQHANYAVNRDFLMTYLNLDGTPFTSGFSGTDYYKTTFAEECTGRDLRLAQTVRTPGFKRSGKPYAPDLVFSKTGYQPIKWLYDRTDKDEISSSTATDVPLIRYAEVLLAYAEAKAEMGQCDQAVWDKTIKPLRERAGVTSIYPTSADPYMVNYFLGSVTDPVILEVRRERGIEMFQENQRQQDIRRWHMGELLVAQKTGMWIPAIETDLDLDGDGTADNIVSAVLTEKAGMKVLTINVDGMPNKSSNNHRLSEGDHGYILPYQANRAQYRWEEKKYLYPVPGPSVTLNSQLDQNAGW